MDLLFAILLYFGVIPMADVTGEPPTTATLASDPAAATDPSDSGDGIAKPRPCGNRCSY